MEEEGIEVAEVVVLEAGVEVLEAGVEVLEPWDVEAEGVGEQVEEEVEEEEVEEEEVGEEEEVEEEEEEAWAEEEDKISVRISSMATTLEMHWETLHRVCLGMMVMEVTWDLVEGEMKTMVNIQLLLIKKY